MPTKEAFMFKARLGKEIVVRVTNEIGILNHICRLVAEKGVSVIAVHGSVDGALAVIRLITSDNLRIGDTLRAHKYSPHESDCVLADLPNKPGVLRTITEKLATEAIDIHHIYATAAENQETSLVALSTSNNDRTLVVLNR
jgi:hypothetical protein